MKESQEGPKGPESTQEALRELRAAAEDFASALGNHLANGMPHRLQSPGGKHKIRVDANMEELSIFSLAKKIPGCDIVVDTPDPEFSSRRDECLTITPHGPRGTGFSGLSVKRHHFWPGKTFPNVQPDPNARFFGERRSDQQDMVDEVSRIADGTTVISSLDGKRVTSMGSSGVEVQKVEEAKGIMQRIRKSLSSVIPGLSCGQENLSGETELIPHSVVAEKLKTMAKSLRAATQTVQEGRKTSLWVQNDSEFR